MPQTRLTYRVNATLTPEEGRRLEVVLAQWGIRWTDWLRAMIDSEYDAVQSEQDGK